VTDLENEAFVERFTEEEVRKAIFQMEQNKAPGPDGFLLNSIRPFGVQ